MTHYILLRTTEDPRGVQIVAVLHVQSEGEHALKRAAEIECEQANTRRRHRFEDGEAVGRLLNVRDFNYRYSLIEVPE